MTLWFLTVEGVVMVSFSEKSEEGEFMERRAGIWFCRQSLRCVLDIKWRCQPNSWYGSLELSGMVVQGRALLGVISRMRHLSCGTSELCRVGGGLQGMRGQTAVQSSALGLPKFKSLGKEEGIAREAGRTCPQAIFATSVESIPEGLTGRHHEGI